MFKTSANILDFSYMQQHDFQSHMLGWEHHKSGQAQIEQKTKKHKGTKRDNVWQPCDQ